MKKIFLALPFLLSLLLFAACDPAEDDKDTPSANVTSEELTNELQITAKSDGNNNLTIATSPTRYIKVYDAETNAMVGSGTNVTVQVVPPARTVSYYVTTAAFDGTVIKSSSKSIAVSEFTDLPEIFNDIFGDGNGGYTTTTWVWDDTDNDSIVWGNGGYLESTAPDWWKVSINDIDGQASDKGLPNDGKDGWFSLDLSSGVKTSRGETGTVTVNANVVKSGWDIGTITFSGTIPLMGVLVNNGNQRQYTYQILKADGDHLYLCAPEPGAGDWGTAWFWCFKKKK